MIQKEQAAHLGDEYAAEQIRRLRRTIVRPAMLHRPGRALTMNLRTALLLGLAGLAASTAATAHAIAMEEPSMGVEMRPTGVLLEADVARPAILNAASSGGPRVIPAANAAEPNVSEYFVADGALTRHHEKGIWGFQFRRDWDANETPVVPVRDAASSPTSDTVSVPEPETLGLIGVGLLILGFFTRRARVMLRGRASIA